MVCARSWDSISNKGVSTQRTLHEVDQVQKNSKDPLFLQNIASILSKCPSELLLLLKTNDLLRGIDQNLGVDSNIRYVSKSIANQGWYCLPSINIYGNMDFYRWAKIYFKLLGLEIYSLAC